MICPGCNANLSLGQRIPITMTDGKLYTACPVCRVEMKISVDNDGTVIHMPVEFSTKEKVKETTASAV